MRSYLDASVLLPLIVEEAASGAVDDFIDRDSGGLIVGDFAAAEVASALSRLVRTRVLDAHDASARLADFDVWRAADAQALDVERSDVRAAGLIVRRFELMLRTPDALHLAICQRLDAPLITLDRRLALAARAMGVEVELLAPG